MLPLQMHESTLTLKPLNCKKKKKKKKAKLADAGKGCHLQKLWFIHSLALPAWTVEPGYRLVSLGDWLGSSHFGSAG